MQPSLCSHRAFMLASMLLVLGACLPIQAWAQGSAPAACNSFTDDPLSAGTPVKAIHITQLRACVDAWRSNAGLGAYGWTDPTLSATVTPIKAIHLTQLRDAIAAVYVAYGRPAPTYSDPSIVPGVTEIRRAHVAELRTAARLNAPPVITGPSDQTSAEGAPVSVAITASDPEGSALTYGASGLPPGLSVNTSTGVISGTMSAAIGSSYSVTVTASDGSWTTTRVFTWTIAEAATFIYDTFHQLNGQSLGDHTFDVGPSELRWQWLRGLHIPEIANETVHAFASPQSEAWTTDVGLANVTLSVDVHSTDPTPYGGLVFRASDSDNYLFVRYDGPYLYKRVNGDYQSIAAASLPFNAGETHRLKVRAIGTQIDVYSDDVLQFSATEAFNQAATRHGLLWNPTEDPTLTFDNFELRSPQPITIIPGPAPCGVTVSPLSMTVNNENNTWSLITVTNQPGCGDWSYDSEADHIPQIGRHDSGVNTSTVYFSIENNTNANPRTLHFQVAGHTVTVVQAGISQPVPPPPPPPPPPPDPTPPDPASTCELSASATPGASPDTFILSIESSPGCEWTTSANEPWVTVDTSSGIGNDEIGVTVDRSAITTPVIGPLSTISPFHVITHDPGVVPLQFKIPCPIDGSWFFCGIVNIGIGPIGPAPGTASIKIIEANLETDQLRIQLVRGVFPTTLNISVTGKAVVSTTIVAEVKTAGTYSYSFSSKLTNVANGHFEKVTASWDGQKADKAVAFRVLGKFLHTRYNSPNELSCRQETSTEREVNLDTGCSTPNGFTSWIWTPGVNTQFADEVNENGSGFSIDHGKVQLEQFCSPRYQDPKYDWWRPDLSVIRGAYGVVNESTVAFNPAKMAFVSKGDKILIVGTGVKTVTDKCPSCDEKHFDNYTFDQNCAPRSIHNVGTDIQTILLK